MKLFFFGVKVSKVPAYLGILLPLIMLLKPQVKAHIKDECIKMTAGINDELIVAMDKPCKLIAESLSDCLIKESEKSGKILQIVSDLISKNYGNASEAVTQKCIASTLGLPENSLDKVPLAVLINTMQNRKDENRKSDNDEVDEEQNDLIEDITKVEPKVLDKETVANENKHPKGGDSYTENKMPDAKDELEESGETIYMKEMPKFES